MIKKCFGLTAELFGVIERFVRMFAEFFGMIAHGFFYLALFQLWYDSDEFIKYFLKAVNQVERKSKEGDR